MQAIILPTRKQNFLHNKKIYISIARSFDDFSDTIETYVKTFSNTYYHNNLFKTFSNLFLFKISIKNLPYITACLIQKNATVPTCISVHYFVPSVLQPHE